MRSAFKVYSHLTCPTSYRLFKKLRSSGALGSIVLIDTGLDPFGAISSNVVSVPAIFYNDTLIYSGYFDVDEAVNTISTGSLPSLEDFDYTEASVMAMEGLLDSYATALWIFLTDRIESPFGLRSFIEAVSRHVFYKHRSNESYERLRRETIDLYRSERNLYLERLREVVARNVIREIIWLGKDPNIYREEISPEYMEHLLLARTAIGRIGLFMGYGGEKIHGERVRDLYTYLTNRWRDIVESVLKETKKILGDSEYVNEYTKKLEEHGLAAQP
ncbi:MAG TPA: hypothetical protein VNL13_00535 [Sulfolobales archaeon]|nr:hypothetical protein [Sulfolobales archaeon]